LTEVQCPLLYLFGEKFELTFADFDKDRSQFLTCIPAIGKDIAQARDNGNGWKSERGTRNSDLEHRPREQQHQPESLACMQLRKMRYRNQKNELRMILTKSKNILR
jgi:hypothetical protein